MKDSQKILTATALFLSVFLLLSPPPLKAQQPSQLDILQADINAKKPVLEVDIPGLKFGDVVTSTDQTGTYVHLPWLPELISAIYKFGIAVASIVAVVVIILQGVRVIASGGGEKKAAAYKKILQAVIGLFIAWGSYAILYTINPELVQFKALKVKVIEAELLPEREASEDAGGEKDLQRTAHGKGDVKTADLTPCPSLTPGTKFTGAFTTYYSVPYGNPTARHIGAYKGSNAAAYGGQRMADFLCVVAMECGCPYKNGKQDKATNDINCSYSPTGKKWNPCNYFGPETRFCSPGKYTPGFTVAASTCFPKGCALKVGDRTLRVEDRGSGIVGTHFDLYVGTLEGGDYLSNTSWLTTDIEIINCSQSFRPANAAKKYPGEKAYMWAKYNAYKPGVCTPNVNC